MSMNNTPSGERTHIGFFGKRNAGKSSLVNAVTGQELSVVSEVFGTTTDPVQKAMELLPLGPVLIIDTPGIDDEGYLGELRVKKTKQVLNRTDLAILVVDATIGITSIEEQMIALFKEKEIPYFVVFNKIDLVNKQDVEDNVFGVSAQKGIRIHELKEKMATMVSVGNESLRIVGDLLHPRSEERRVGKECPRLCRSWWSPSH